MSGIAALGGVEPHAVYGQPAEELALYSASLDLLVVGARGYGPLGRLIHGSTSQQLAHTARCPLLVLTRAVHAIEIDEAAPQAGWSTPRIKDSSNRRGVTTAIRPTCRSLWQGVDRLMQLNRKPAGEYWIQGGAG